MQVLATWTRSNTHPVRHSNDAWGWPRVAPPLCKAGRAVGASGTAQVYACHMSKAAHSRVGRLFWKALPMLLTWRRMQRDGGGVPLLVHARKAPWKPCTLDEFPAHLVRYMHRTSYRCTSDMLCQQQSAISEISIAYTNKSWASIFRWNRNGRRGQVLTGIRRMRVLGAGVLKGQ